MYHSVGGGVLIMGKAVQGWGQEDLENLNLQLSLAVNWNCSKI